MDFARRFGVFTMNAACHAEYESVHMLASRLSLRCMRCCCRALTGRWTLSQQITFMFLCTPAVFYILCMAGLIHHGSTTLEVRLLT